MFFKTAHDSVRNDEGYTVFYLGHGKGVRYRQGRYSALVFCEVLATGGIALFPESLTSWEHPHEREPVSESQRAEIMERTAAGLRFMGREVVVT